MEVTERGIIVQGWGVQAIQKGLKTETRRLMGLKLINAHPDWWEHFGFDQAGRYSFRFKGGDQIINIACPYGKVGQKLYIKETHRFDIAYDGRPANGLIIPKGVVVECKVEPHAVITEGDGHRELKYPGKWRPSIFMPRWATRIWLEITEIRLERLQSITEEDAIREGFNAYRRHVVEGIMVDPRIGRFEHISAFSQFRSIWDKINGKTFPWKINPWVWVICFKTFIRVLL